MKKKIIFLAVCAVLLLFFVSSSYGEWDPKYKLRGHPDQEPLLSAPNGDQLDDVLLLIFPNWNRFSLLIYIKSDSHDEIPNSQRVKERKVNFRPNNVRK